jgi:hypothetical protein
MKRRPTLDWIEFDNETYEILYQARPVDQANARNATPAELPAEPMRALQLAAPERSHRDCLPFAGFSDNRLIPDADDEPARPTGVWLH